MFLVLMEGGMEPAKDLIAALQLGEAACLTMMVFEPITSTVSKWQNAAKRIRSEREKLERAALQANEVSGS